MRIRLWNSIYEEFMQNNPECRRTLPQVKKRQQNLEYEVKQLKFKVRKTGVEGFLYIKQKFPYNDIMDDIMGHRDNIDPDNMELEGSNVIVPPSQIKTRGSEPSSSRTAQTALLQDNQPQPSSASVEPAGTERVDKGKAMKKRARGRKRKRDDMPDAESDFLKMWVQSLEAEAQRFERCMMMQQQMQQQQMQQNAALLSGFKDIFKELSKKD